jgi:hypothetical protein
LEVNKALEKSIKKEKLEARRTSIKFLERIEDRVKEQTEKIAKLRSRIEKVTNKLHDLEKKASAENLDQIKLEVEKDLKEKLERIDKLKDNQRRIYKHEFDSLNDACLGVTQTN